MVLCHINILDHGDGGFRAMYVRSSDICDSRWCNGCTFGNLLFCNGYTYELPRSVYDALPAYYQNEVDAVPCLTIIDEEDGDGCEDGEVKYDYCDDGSEIVTDRCVGGEWVETGNTCPEGEDMTECNQAIRNLLKHYDSNNDGTISQAELMTAAGDLKAGSITQAEFGFIDAAWKLGENGIAKICPMARKTDTTTYIIIGVVLLGLYLYLRG